jgi:hypothetical protein
VNNTSLPEFSLICQGQKIPAIPKANAQPLTSSATAHWGGPAGNFCAFLVERKHLKKLEEEEQECPSEQSHFQTGCPRNTSSTGALNSKATLLLRNLQEISDVDFGREETHSNNPKDRKLSFTYTGCKIESLPATQQLALRPLPNGSNAPWRSVTGNSEVAVP